MFKNEEHSSFLNIFMLLVLKLIYKFCMSISTFRVFYKATTVSLPFTMEEKLERRAFAKYHCKEQKEN